MAQGWAESAWDAIIIGGGAAGLMAAIRAAELGAEKGARILLLEKGKKPGVKILMSGGSRCNITHHCSNRDIATAFGKNGQCLLSPLSSFGVEDTVRFFEAEGVKTKIESTGKIFPVSNKASDVLEALLHRLERTGAVLACEKSVQSIKRGADGFTVAGQGFSFLGKRILIASGGKSFPRCGTTGDAYTWLKELGHSIVSTHPSLVPLTTNLPWIRDLSGITLKDTRVEVGTNGKAIAADRNAWLFTHFGYSGPAPMNLSRWITTSSGAGWLRLDSLPELSAQAVESHILQSLPSMGKRSLVSLLAHLFGEAVPQRWAEALVGQASIPLERKGSELGKTERQKLVQALKGLQLQVAGSCGFDKAEVTAGGVNVKEVDFKTMQSRIVPNLFLAGEILDLDGPIGGFNFQSAWSTGWRAGTSLVSE